MALVGNMVKISVLIPFYNVEEYIEKCLDTVINQTFKDIEIICIDDKSTDDSLKIVNEYALKDSRIKIYKNDENQGVAKTRNFALNLAKGKYIYFLDSDDFIELDTLEKLYNLAEEKSLDIIIFKLLEFIEGGDNVYVKNYYSESRILLKTVPDKVFNYKDITPYLLMICVNLQGKLFKRELIQDIKFAEGLIFEDIPFFIESMFKAKRVYYYDEFLCHKRYRKKSITRTLNESFIDIIDITNHTIDISKRYNNYDELKTILIQNKINCINIFLWRVNLKYNSKFFKKMKEDYISHKNEIEEVYDDLDIMYKIIYDTSIKSGNYYSFRIREVFQCVLHSPRFLKEYLKARSIWR